jgi:hypothetical protein
VSTWSSILNKNKDYLILNCEILIPKNNYIAIFPTQGKELSNGFLVNNGEARLILSDGREITMIRNFDEGVGYSYFYNFENENKEVFLEKAIIKIPRSFVADKILEQDSSGFPVYEVSTEICVAFGTNINDENKYYYSESEIIQSESPSGKVLNDYNTIDFPNKLQWMEASKLPPYKLDNINHGDLPTPAILTVDFSTITSKDFEEGTSFTNRMNVNGNALYFNEKQYVKKNTKIVLDTKTGICTRQDGDEGEKILLGYTGDGITTVASGEEPSVTVYDHKAAGSTCTFEFDYLYY